MQKKTCKSSELQDLLLSLLRQSWVVRDMFGLGITEKTLYAEMSQFIPQIQKFLQNYMPANAGPGKLKAGTNTNGLKKSWNGTIENVLDCEENFWSPRFGLKGKIDMTVAVNDSKGKRVRLSLLRIDCKSFYNFNFSQLPLYFS